MLLIIEYYSKSHVYYCNYSTHLYKYHYCFKFLNLILIIQVKANNLFNYSNLYQINMHILSNLKLLYISSIKN